MAAITIADARKVSLVGLAGRTDILSGPRGEANMSAGVAVAWDATTGKFVLANAATQAAADRYVGVNLTWNNEDLINTAIDVAAGEGVQVELGGTTLDALNYGAFVYLSDTPGVLSDTPGTINVKVGRVMPAWIDNTPRKILRLERR